MSKRDARPVREGRAKRREAFDRAVQAVALFEQDLDQLAACAGSPSTEPESIWTDPEMAASGLPISCARPGGEFRPPPTMRSRIPQLLLHSPPSG